MATKPGTQTPDDSGITCYCLFLFAEIKTNAVGIATNLGSSFLLCLFHISSPFVFIRFRTCCERALNAAARLASWCGNVEKDSLLDYYKESATCQWFETMQQPALDLLDEENEMDEEEELARNQPLAFSTSMTVLICFVYPPKFSTTNG